MTMKQKIIDLLRWSEKYTGTDMIYLAKGGAWTFLANAGVSFIALLTMMAFGHFLDVETYGIYTYIVTMAGLFGIFSLPGINTALFKSVAQKKEGTLFLAVKTKLKWSLIGSVVFLLIAGWYFLNQNSTLGLLFSAGALFLPFISVFPIFSPFWQAKKKFDTYCKYELISDIFIAISLVAAIILTKNIIMIVLAYFLSHTVFYGIILKKTLKRAAGQEEDETAISFGKNLTVMGAIAGVAEQIDKVIIWKFLGPVSLAIYSFAQMPVYKINSLLPIATLALPKLGEKNIKEIKAGIMKKFTKLFLLTIPLSIFIVLTAPYLYKIIFPRYVESVPYFQALAIIIFLSPFTLISASLISAMKKKELYLIQTVTPSLKIILFLVLIPLFQIWGAIFSVLISQVLNGLLVLYFFRKI